MAMGGGGSLEVSGYPSLIWVQERRISRPVYQWRQDRKAFKAFKAYRVLRGLQERRVGKEQPVRWVRQVCRDSKALPVRRVLSVRRGFKAFKVLQGLKALQVRPGYKVRPEFKVREEVPVPSETPDLSARSLP